MKNWWSSKTVWLGILTSIIGLIELLVRSTGGSVPPIVYEIELIAAGIVAIIFRRLTNTPLSGKIKP